jgi:hypothetical protein
MFYDQYHRIGRRMTSHILVGVLAVLVLATPALANSLPTASAQSDLIEPGSSTTLTLQASDADADPLTYIVSSLPTKGSLSEAGAPIATGDLPHTLAGATVTYTADSDAHGDDTFNFKANDGTGDSEAATVTITVNQAPVASSSTFATEPNNDLTIDLPIVDPDSDTLTFTVTSLTGHGLLMVGSAALMDDDLPYELTQSKIVYTPDQDYHGPDSFTITATDGNESSGSVTVSINVNTTPVPEDVSMTLLPEGSTTIELAGSDADKDEIVYVIASLPAHGSLAALGETILESQLPHQLAEGVASVTYQVKSGYLGTDSFHYRVQDLPAGAASDRAVVTIAVNTPPTASAASITADQSTVTEAALSATDSDGDALTCQITQLPTAGTLKIENTAVTEGASFSMTEGALSYTYEVTDTSAASDSFQWVASDGRQQSSTATVAILILGITGGTGGDDTPDDGDTDDSTDDSSGDDTSEDDGGDGSSSGSGCGPVGAGESILAALAFVLWSPFRQNRRFLRRNSDRTI